MAAVEEYRCFVGGLAWATDDGRLGDAFRAFGDVLESKVINDRESGRSRGFGFVTFGDEASMRNAIDNMNGKELDGRNITVNQAQSRSGGGGGGRSNGGGGYGERSYGGGGNKSYGGDRSYGERSYGNSRSEGRNGGDRGYGGGGGGGGYGGRSGGGGGGYGGSEGGSWRRE